MSDTAALATFRWAVVLAFIIAVVFMLTDIRRDVNAIKHSVVTTTTTRGSSVRTQES